jgi:hypothetical protein
VALPQVNAVQQPQLAATAAGGERTVTARSTRRRSGGEIGDPSPAALRTLELTVKRKLDGVLQGNHLGLIPGPGSEPGSRGCTSPATTCAGWTGR